MARRKKAAATAEHPSEAPEWLFHFRYAEWVEGCSPGNPDPDTAGRPYMGSLELYEKGRRRWHAAVVDWLAERDLFMWDHRMPSGGYSELKELERDQPWRVVANDWQADADMMRERAALVMAAYGGAANAKGQRFDQDD
ncbi:hypothetical protein [Microbispora sp. GKU 823]|uniref:hypothetical protein n=1 Tax=Microbispora sp. GKU 823 TaxID=1652100 RepID=UPI00117CF9AC|nr:hypothetical protein [Microbispora sp. GKU 823]